MVASSPRFRPYEARRRPAVFEYASTPRLGLQRLARGIGVREPKRGISSERGDAAPSRSGAIAVVNRVLEYFRPFSRPPAFIAETADLPEIIAGVVYWEAIRVRATGLSDRGLARMAAELAEAYQAAGMRVAGDRRCPIGGDEINPHPG
jgi:hypothetical protein